MAVVKFNVSLSGITEDFLVRIWEAASDSPEAPVYEVTLVEKNSGGTPTPGAGHQVIETVTFNGADNVVHIVRIYGVTSGVKWNEFNLESKVESTTVFLPIQFKIGDGGVNTPAADQDTAVTPELIGFTPEQFLINRNNYGILIEGTHFAFDSPTGTWILTDPDKFNGESGGEEFTIMRQPLTVTTVVNDSVVGKWFGQTPAGDDIFFNISANTNYAAAHLRKLLRFTGAFEYSFTADPPKGYAFVFQHFANTASPAKVKFDNANLLWAGSPKAEIEIPQYSEGCFVFDGTNWNVIFFNSTSFANAPATPPGTILKVGEQAQGDIPAGDPVITITHNANIVGDYHLIVTFKSNSAATYFRNNKICWSWHHHATDKPNKVYLTPQEISAEAQDITICYMLVKV